MSNKIQGGYVLQPRKLDDSSVMREPPGVRELWQYICRKVNWKNSDECKRGEGFFRLKEIQDDLSWRVGYRLEKYSKPQLTKFLRKLRERDMIATTKETRGIRISVCHYDFYQDPRNYEGNGEEHTKATRKQRSGITILEEGEEGNKSPQAPQGASDVPEKELLPANASRMTKADQRATRVQGCTERMKRIGSWYGRRTDTPWTVYETLQLIRINPSDENIALMEKYYTSPDADFKRRDVPTLLNNWQGELDRARNFTGAPKRKPQSNQELALFSGQ